MPWYRGFSVTTEALASVNALHWQKPFIRYCVKSCCLTTWPLLALARASGDWPFWVTPTGKTKKPAGLIHTLCMDSASFCVLP